MCDIRYFKRALSLYGTASREYSVGCIDEYAMNTVAYSLQQVVELVLKCHLEFVGVTVPSTHDISKLVRMCKNNGAGVIITEWIDDNSEKLTMWEAQTRYNMDFFVEGAKARVALQKIKEFMDENYITKEEVPEVQCNLVALRRLLPRDLKVEGFEYNLYFSLFKKSLMRDRKLDNSELVECEEDFGRYN